MAFKKFTTNRDELCVTNRKKKHSNISILTSFPVSAGIS
jgi:hypothetical protein